MLITVILILIACLSIPIVQVILFLQTKKSRFGTNRSLMRMEIRTNDFVADGFSSCIKKLSSSWSSLTSLSWSSLLSTINVPWPRCAALATLFEWNERTKINFEPLLFLRDPLPCRRSCDVIRGAGFHWFTALRCTGSAWPNEWSSNRTKGAGPKLIEGTAQIDYSSLLSRSADIDVGCVAGGREGWSASWRKIFRCGRTQIFDTVHLGEVARCWLLLFCCFRGPLADEGRDGRRRVGSSSS